MSAFFEIQVISGAEYRLLIKGNVADANTELDSFLAGESRLASDCREVVVKTSVTTLSTGPDFDGNYYIYDLPSFTDYVKWSGLRVVVFESPPTNGDVRKIIPRGMFEGHVLMDTITLQTGYTEVSRYAFAGCVALQNVTIPNTVTTLGNGAFEGYAFIDGIFTPNTVWTSLTLPSSITTIGTYVFNENDNLVVTFTSTSQVVSIGEFAFNATNTVRPNQFVINGTFENAAWLTTVPSAIPHLVAAPANQAVVLSWTPPIDFGGSLLSNYRIEVSEGTWNTLDTISPSLTMYTHTGLTIGTPYSYRMYSSNATGESSASSEVSATPQTLTVGGSVEITIDGMPTSVQVVETATTNFTSFSNNNFVYVLDDPSAAPVLSVYTAGDAGSAVFTALENGADAVTVSRIVNGVTEVSTIEIALRLNTTNVTSSNVQTVAADITTLPYDYSVLLNTETTNFSSSTTKAKFYFKVVNATGTIQTSGFSVPMTVVIPGTGTTPVLDIYRYTGASYVKIGEAINAGANTYTFTLTTNSDIELLTPPVPCIPPVIRFKSASEVTEYLKRKATTTYYNNNTASQKQAHASTITTYLGGVVYNCTSTCCTTPSGGFVQRPEKQTSAQFMNKWNPT